jgi:hypothetical protein
MQALWSLACLAVIAHASFVIRNEAGDLELAPNSPPPKVPAIVSASYTNNTMNSGWGYLEVAAVSEASSIPAILEAYKAAGFAEGRIC